MLTRLVMVMIIRAHLVGVFTWERISLHCSGKYIIVGSCCTQLLLMQKLLFDYGICQKHLIIYCDNISAINISKNPVQHSCTKHIEIRHHFIRDLVKDGILTLHKTFGWS